MLRVSRIRNFKFRPNNLHLPFCLFDRFVIRDNIIQGQQNYQLTGHGFLQAEATARRLKSVNYWQAHTSDLARASRTADVILAEHDGPVLVKSQLLREFALGVLEDLPRGTSSYVELMRMKILSSCVCVCACVFRARYVTAADKCRRLNQCCREEQKRQNNKIMSPPLWGFR